MGALFKAAEVIVGDGPWSVGYEVDSSCGVALTAVNPCDLVKVIDLNPGDDDWGPGAYEVVPFGIESRITRANRCLPDDPAVAEKRLEEATEDMLARVLAEGKNIDPALVTFNSTLVSTITANANTPPIADLANWWRDNGLGAGDPVIHLGMKRAADALLGPADLVAMDKLAGSKIVMSGAYPPTLGAISGPIKIRLTTVTSDQFYDTPHNRAAVVATRIAAIEIDPCLIGVLT